VKRVSDFCHLGSAYRAIVSSNRIALMMILGCESDLLNLVVLASLYEFVPDKVFAVVDQNELRYTVH
jgi:hypothetical protein